MSLGWHCLRQQRLLFNELQPKSRRTEPKGKILVPRLVSAKVAEFESKRVLKRRIVAGP